MVPRGYVCCRASEPPAFDGRLADGAWRDALWTEDFLDIEGGLRPAPRFRTRAKMLWDDDFFYLAAEMEEPHVWATLTEHDSVIFQDPDFEVFLDPDGDNHNYYEIEINALGTVWDLRLVKPYRDGGPALNEWHVPGLQKAVHVGGTLNDPSDTDRGWTVELALPWTVLAEYAGRPTPPQGGDQWRVNFSRVEWDVTVEDGRYVKVPDTPEHNWVWSPQGVIDMHRPERWGYVQFSRDTPGTAPFRPDPSAPARDLLMDVYHAQHAHRQAHGQWAETLSVLRPLPSSPFLSSLQMTTTPGGFTATVTYDTETGPQRLHVRADSRLWSDDLPLVSRFHS